MTKRTKAVVWVAAFLAAFIILSLIVYPVFQSANLAARKSVAVSNLKNLLISWELYADDNNDMSCDTKNWNHDLASYCEYPFESIIVNPAIIDGSDQRNFGLNSAVGRIDLSIQDSGKSLVVFATTSQAGANAWVDPRTISPFAWKGGPALVARHPDTVRILPQSDFSNLHWIPIRAKK